SPVPFAAVTPASLVPSGRRCCGAGWVVQGVWPMGDGNVTPPPRTISFRFPLPSRRLLRGDSPGL
ncbi:MAG: hypothetical protein J7M26_00770, partial [Armatimonadetes bacterium]|nr:hypothetical protein [Armatimonadota bacterium]